MDNKIKGDNKLYYTYDSKVFLDTFVNHKYNKNEIMMADNMYARIFDFYQKVYNPAARILSPKFLGKNLHACSYIDDIGYYTIKSYENSENFEVQKHGYDLDNAFISILDDLLYRKAVVYETNNRRTLKKYFNKSFGNSKYFSDFYIIKYILDAYGIYYNDNIPEEITNEYLGYLDAIYNYYQSRNNSHIIGRKYNVNSEELKKRILTK